MTLEDIDTLLGDLDRGELKMDQETALEAVPLPPIDPLVIPSDVSPGTIGALTRAIKGAFLSSKRPEEIALVASGMPLRDWMDFAIRLMPKEVAVKGQFQVQQLIGQMGPLKR